MRRFKYFPPLIINNITFLILTVFFLVFLGTKGAEKWAWLMQHMSLGFFVVVIGFVFYLSVFWLVGIPYLLLDKFKKPIFLYQYKIQETSEAPKRYAQKVPLSKAVIRVLSNQFLGTWPFLGLVYILMTKLGYTQNVPIPHWWVVLLQLAALVLIEDILFFASHHTMHRKYFFKKFHWVHHEYRETIAIATHYVHYVEHIIGNLCPVFIGVLILQPHPFVILFWILLVVLNALHTHSGYAFPWMSYAVHHDWHHYHVNGSYSAIGLMDRLFGTDAGFEKIGREYKENNPK
jgi:sterol desaturase/sphingolipid hydroxylase (fatty acid hydroxylase superfamily)